MRGAALVPLVLAREAASSQTSRSWSYSGASTEVLPYLLVLFGSTLKEVRCDADLVLRSLLDCAADGCLSIMRLTGRVG